MNKFILSYLLDYWVCGFCSFYDRPRYTIDMNFLRFTNDDDAWANLERSEVRNSIKLLISLGLELYTANIRDESP